MAVLTLTITYLGDINICLNLLDFRQSSINKAFAGAGFVFFFYLEAATGATQEF